MDSGGLPHCFGCFEGVRFHAVKSTAGPSFRHWSRRQWSSQIRTSDRAGGSPRTRARHSSCEPLTTEPVETKSPFYWSIAILSVGEILPRVLFCSKVRWTSVSLWTSFRIWIDFTETSSSLLGQQNFQTFLALPAARLLSNETTEIRTGEPSQEWSSTDQWVALQWVTESWGNLFNRMLQLRLNLQVFFGHVDATDARF